MESWDEVRRWRKGMREALMAKRLAVPRDDRHAARDRVVERLRGEVPAGSIGFYWAIKGELDLRAFVAERIEAGAVAALPVVVEERQPVEFWRWEPAMKMQRGFWNIPVPPARDLVGPDILLVPLLGFDEAGYRLGYGGGYYDRTLAAASPRPLTIGIGLELGRLATIHPQPHDIPMDAIVTEAGVRWHRRRGQPIPATSLDEDPNSRASFASPPCFMHERRDE